MLQFATQDSAAKQFGESTHTWIGRRQDYNRYRAHNPLGAARPRNLQIFRRWRAHAEEPCFSRIPRGSNLGARLQVVTQVGRAESSSSCEEDVLGLAPCARQSPVWRALLLPPCARQSPDCRARLLVRFLPGVVVRQWGTGTTKSWRTIS